MAVDPARIDKFRRLPIDGQSFKRLIDAGLTWLRTNKDTVNALNVFPVPDGDTGTNMTLTLQAAWNEICLLYTSPSPRDRTRSRMPSSA